MSDDSSTEDWTVGSGDDMNTSPDIYVSPEESEGPFLSHTRPDSELIETYYTVYKGLSNSSSSHRALPTELVLYICRLAEFVCQYTKKAPVGRRRVYASSQVVQSLIWFQTEPFTKRMLRHVKSIQLVTMSHHQGWVSDRDGGSWSWFEFQVATDQGDVPALVKRQSNGDEISWCCLEHPVDRETAEVQGDFAKHEGSIFDSDHELWTQIEEGDVLQVVMKAQFGGWSNVASDGVVRISTWWEPSIEMLGLVDKNNSNT
ncbi:unnamed protein product [Rhizoctonia solani]|nr:unnamed protein product [Rhizoctonia solani]